MNKKKKVMIVIIVLVAIILIGGGSYAWFNYYQESNLSNRLIAGDMRLKMQEGQDTITLTNVFPETKEEARARNNNTLTFTLSGANTSNKPIIYRILLNRGSEKNGKTRFLDNELKFDLVEINGSTENYLVDNASYSELSNTIIYVGKVLGNTDNISHTYRLRVWIDENVVISETEIGRHVYTPNEYKNLYATVKLTVKGDMNEEEISTPISCFSLGYRGELALNNELSQEEFSSKCISSLNNYTIGGISLSSMLQEGESIESFCNGTGTINGMNQETIFMMISSVGITNEMIDSGLVVGTISDVGIINYDSTCGVDVSIPSRVNGKVITTIGVGAFQSKGLTSVRIPNTVTSIDENAFSDNLITSLDIPESVRFIMYQGFKNNPLESLTLHNGINTISDESFANSNLTEVTIPASVGALPCNAFYKESGNPVQLTYENPEFTCS